MYPSINLVICTATRWPIHPRIHQPTHLSNHPFIHSFVTYLSTYLSALSSIYSFRWAQWSVSQNSGVETWTQSWRNLRSFIISVISGDLHFRGHPLPSLRWDNSKILPRTALWRVMGWWRLLLGRQDWPLGEFGTHSFCVAACMSSCIAQLDSLVWGTCGQLAS